MNASSEPYVGAFADLEGENLIVWRAEMFEYDYQYLAIPGQITEIDKHSGAVFMACGEGILKITDVSYKGERSAPATFIKSIRTRLR